MDDTKYKKILDSSMPSEVPPDSEIFTTPIIENTTENQFFNQIPQAESIQFVYKSISNTPKFLLFKLNFAQKIVLISLVCLAGFFTFMKFVPKTKGNRQNLEQNHSFVPNKTSHKTQKSDQVLASESKPSVEIKSLEESNSPVTITTARKYYQERNYEYSYLVYDKLYRKLVNAIDDPLFADYFRFEQAVCKLKLGEYEKAAAILESLSNCTYPSIRSFVDYYSSLMLLKNGQYFEAATAAYKALGMLWSIDFDEDLFNSVYKNCHFIIAESLTKKVLMSSSNDQIIPEELWYQKTATDPFFKVEIEKLNDVIRNGKDKVDGSIVGSVIEEQRNGIRRWNIICNDTPLEELLIRFSGRSNLDISWKSGESPAVPKSIRNRNVTVYLPAITAQQFVKVAAGSVGLIASVVEGQKVNIYNPEDYTQLSVNIRNLRSEAISLWQKYIIAFKDDAYISNAHFALGLLYAESDNITNAIAEYKIVGGKWSRLPLVPYALLNSSKLKEELKDIEGARSDLMRIAEQYPNSQICDSANLYLADLTMESGLYSDALKIYEKLFNITSDGKLQESSSFGAGMCYAENKDYENAAKWLARYVGAADKKNNPNLYRAYYVLGQSYAAVGRNKQSCEILETAIAGALSPNEYLNAAQIMVNGYIAEKNYSKAIAVLEKANRSNFTEYETVELILLKNRIYKSLDLYDRAISELSNIVKYISDSNLEMKVRYEQARCLSEKSDYQSASQILSEILVNAKPGELLNEAILELADVCFKLEKDNQTISLCKQVLESNAPQKIKSRASGLLSKAYSRQKDYDKAALALLGKYKDTGK